MQPSCITFPIPLHTENNNKAKIWEIVVIHIVVADATISMTTIMVIVMNIVIAIAMNMKD